MINLWKGKRFELDVYTMLDHKEDNLHVLYYPQGYNKCLLFTYINVNDVRINIGFLNRGFVI